jgi:hypothetical protein
VLHVLCTDISRSNSITRSLTILVVVGAALALGLALLLQASNVASQSNDIASLQVISNPPQGPHDALTPLLRVVASTLVVATTRVVAVALVVDTW